MTDMAAALDAEQDLPPDIVLWHGTSADSTCPPALGRLATAGALVIGEPS